MGVKASSTINSLQLGDYNIVALVFTRPGAKGINDVITALQANQAIMNSSVPVMVIWKDANGEINYTCEQLPAKIKWILAQKLASATDNHRSRFGLNSCSHSNSR
ncbi:MAG: hypothetical protein NZ930_06080 [Candidatus Bipolaricaulota bacterium]|nr:hypothetical protein [Candidatus Bipolaricaulota bacterium]MDW8030239.1 hypothetical protein [Candidatus Bipolaricaulota bacterium]